MIWSLTVISLCLLGVLSPEVVEAQEQKAETEVIRPVDKVHLSSKQQRQILSRVVSLVGETLEQLSLRKRSGRIRKTYVPGTFPLDKSRMRVTRHSQLGIAKINYYGEGIICSGVHFKPWIILTTAECVSGRNMNRIYATVTWRDGSRGTYHTAPVEVESITVHPNFVLGSSDYNFALLRIYSRFDWDVDEFVLPRAEVTTDILIDRDIPTFVKEWNEPLQDDATVSNVNEPVTRDFSVCEETEAKRYWYCVVTENTGGRSIYQEMDVGIPLYYRTGSMKRCTGIYTGRFLNQRVGGHLFQSFYQCIDWIDEFIHENPVPPIPS